MAGRLLGKRGWEGKGCGQSLKTPPSPTHHTTQPTPHRTHTQLNTPLRPPFTNTGQTGSGKTHTMEGRFEPPDAQGIIPRTFAHVFEAIEGDPSKEYLVRGRRFSMLVRVWKGEQVECTWGLGGDATEMGCVCVHG